VTVARVCMVALTDYPADARVRREAEALVDRGDEVDVVCPRTATLEDGCRIEGVRLHPVTRFRYSAETRPRDYVFRYGRFVAAAMLTVLRLHRSRRYDVVHVHTMPDVLVFSAAGAKLLGARVILDVHDLMPELYASKFELAESHWVIRLIRSAERCSVAFADHALAVHRPHLEALVRHGIDRDRLTVVMNVPDRKLFSPRRGAPAPDTFTLVYHGMIGRRNGLDVAVRAVARARTEIPELRLRIIGDGDDVGRVAQVVDDLALRDIVRLDRGVVPVEELIPILAQASVGIVPILDDSFTKFMLPVKLLEYVAMGIPVIASATDTIRAYFDESMICFSAPGDSDDLAARIVELYRNPRARARLAEAADRFNAEHNWDSEKATFYGVMDSLVPAKTSHRRRSARARRAAITAGTEAEGP
jgi:glycosyltransferase involved in cell wall biosynthesis